MDSKAVPGFEHLPPVLKTTVQATSSRRDFFWPCINYYIELTIIKKSDD
jgi:hypothetical protein